MRISQEERFELLKLLERSIPAVSDPSLRAMYVLLAALLCDHQEALLDKKAFAEKYLEQLQDCEVRLKQMAERFSRAAEPQDGRPQ